MTKPRFQIRPLHPLFGAEVTGLDLAAADDAAIAEIQQTIGHYGVLAFPGVTFDDDALAAFARRLGPLQNLTSRAGKVLEVTRVSNLDAMGAMLPADSKRRANDDANQFWHVDSTYLTPGATYSLLHARIIPDEGGDTEYCDARIAWEALPADRQAELGALTADHSVRHSRRLIGYEIPEGITGAAYPAVRHRLVRRHAPSGRDALLVASHIEAIAGMTYADARALVEELTGVAAAPNRVYRHKWRVGDLLMWDNRCMMHRATPFPQMAQARDMRSVRVIDPDDAGMATTG